MKLRSGTLHAAPLGEGPLRSLGLAGVAYRHGPLAGDPRLPYFLFPDEPLAVDLLVVVVAGSPRPRVSWNWM